VAVKEAAISRPIMARLKKPRQKAPPDWIDPVGSEWAKQGMAEKAPLRPSEGRLRLKVA